MLLRGSSTSRCNTSRKDSVAKTHWISSIIDCNGIVSSSIPLKLVPQRNARASWKTLLRSGGQSFITQLWLTLRRSSMPSMLRKLTCTKLGSSCVGGVLEIGVPGGRDTPIGLPEAPRRMKSIPPLNRWECRTWKGTRTQIGKSFLITETSPPLRTPVAVTKKPGHTPSHLKTRS